jgi:hypothetical protein
MGIEFPFVETFTHFTERRWCFSSRRRGSAEKFNLKLILRSGEYFNLRI